MRGRQKGQTKKMSIIKDPIIAPYQIYVEEDQYILVDTKKDKALSYHGSLDTIIHKVSRMHLASLREDYTLTGFIESFNNIKNKLTKHCKNV